MSIGMLVYDAASVDRTVSEFRVFDSGGVDRVVAEAWVFDETGADQLFYNPSGSATITVESSPAFVGGLGNGSGIVTTDATTATASNGVAPYTYAWTLLSYTAGIAPTASDSAAATSSFIQTGMSSGTFEASNWRVTATDANSNTATFDVATSFSEP